MAQNSQRYFINPQQPQNATALDTSNTEGTKALLGNGFSEVNGDQFNSYQSTGKYPGMQQPTTAVGTGLADAGTANAIQNPPTPQNNVGLGANTSGPNGQMTDAQGKLIPNGAPQTNLGKAPDDPSNKYNTATGQLNSKYNAALANLNASGKEAPNSNGAASAAVQSATPPPTPPGPNLGAISTALQQSAPIQDMIQQAQQYFSPENQQQTLTQEYQGLVQSTGLNNINTQLMNAKNVIDGTEDDIRNEISKAGGFATNSQVQALAAARNKVLIQNYNNLLDQKNSITDQINTTMGLEEKDRAAASAQLSQQLDLDQKLYTMQQNMQQNAQSALSNMQKSEGWDGVYKAALASGDPNAIQRINSTMGQGFDLATMAKQDATDRATQASKDALTQQQEEANLKKTNLENAALPAKNAADLASTKASTANSNANAAKTLEETKQLKTTPPTTDKFSAPGESDKSKVLSAIPKQPQAVQDSIDKSKLETDPQYFYWVKSQLGV